MVILGTIQLCAIGQSTSLQLERTIESKATYVTFDNLGHFYAVDDDQISKYSEKGDFLLTESFKTLGDITTVDVTNPLKILLFYFDYGQIAFTDNRLAIRGDVLALDQFGLVQTGAACTSYNNGFWVFDQVTFELIRYDRNFRVVNKTANIQQIVGTEIHPSFMREDGNWLYISNPQSGILVFDIYGTYYKTIPFKNVEKFSIYGGRLYALQGSNLVAYHLKTGGIVETELPLGIVRDFSVYNKRLLFSSGKALTIYRIIEP